MNDNVEVVTVEAVELVEVMVVAVEVVELVVEVVVVVEVVELVEVVVVVVELVEVVVPGQIPFRRWWFIAGVRGVCFFFSLRRTVLITADGHGA
ncbi:unnamed protein product [Boreogadus saida]